MSDEKKEESPAAEEGKKKGGKMPIIVAVVLLLAGGGYFMKAKSAKPKPKVEAPKLGEVVDVKELLVNLAANSGYLKTEISLQLAKDAKKEELEKNKAAIADALNLRLKSKRLSDIQTIDQLHELKREIASDLNKILNREKDEKAAEEAEKKKGASEDEGDAKDEAKAADSKTDPKTDEEPAVAKPKVPEDFDSDTGPVLKVYFTSFATQ
jgi:flagellar basal body-associated protein FliL